MLISVYILKVGGELKKLFFVLVDRFNWSPPLHGLWFVKICLNRQNILGCCRQRGIFSERKAYRYSDSISNHGTCNVIVIHLLLVAFYRRRFHSVLRGNLCFLSILF